MIFLVTDWPTPLLIQLLLQYCNIWVTVRQFDFLTAGEVGFRWAKPAAQHDVIFRQTVAMISPRPRHCWVSSACAVSLLCDLRKQQQNDQHTLEARYNKQWGEEWEEKVHVAYQVSDTNTAGTIVPDIDSFCAKFLHRCVCRRSFIFLLKWTSSFVGISVWIRLFLSVLCCFSFLSSS